MHAKTISGQSGARQDIVHLSILLAVGLVIGIYLICTAGVIAKDGVTFIEYARNLQTAPAETMIKEAQHPGYPFLILPAAWALGLDKLQNMSIIRFEFSRALTQLPV